METKTLSVHLKHTLGIEVKTDQAKLLCKHLDHVLSWNNKVNLTSIEDESLALIFHIEDSLSALPFVLSAPKGEMADIGSGGGFPGVPLAIMSNRKTTLVESRDKKVMVLDTYIKANNLEELIKTQSVRAEELAETKGGAYSVVTARALSRLVSVMELAAPLLALKGTLIAYKGNLSTEELEEAKAVQEILGLSLSAVKALCLSDNVSKRSLVVFEKTAGAKLSLPRHVGFAQKKPLSETIKKKN